MNDSDRQRLIHNYLAAADRLQLASEHQKSLEQDKHIFEQVIAELGLSSEQQQHLKQIALDDLNSAQDHFFKNDLAQSIELAERAQQLLPYDLRPLELLLRIYVQEKEPEQARYYATSILNLDPNHREAKQALQQRSDSRMTPVMLAGAGLLLLAGGAALFLDLQQTETAAISAQQIPPAEMVERAPIIPPAPAEKPATTIEAPPVDDIITPTGEDSSRNQLLSTTPPILISDLPMDGLQFIDRGSKLSEYPESFSYAANILLRNNSSQEIKEISGVVELIAPDGSIIVQDKEDFRADYEPALRPGESEGLSTLLYVKSYPKNYKSPTQIRIRFDRFTHYPTAKEISKEAVDLQWPTGHPSQFKVDVQRRVSTDSYGTYNDVMEYWTVENTYEITNRGQSIIKSLKLQQELLSENGTVLHKDSHLVTYSSKPHIAPDETRLEYFIVASLPQKVAHIRLSVIEIK